MAGAEIIAGIKEKFPDFNPLSVESPYSDEVRIKAGREDFKGACLALHEALVSPAGMFFACDRRREKGCFELRCVFADLKGSRWITVLMETPQDKPYFDTLAGSMHSASLFEREILEMFGIQPRGNPDLRRLRLHEEIWPEGNYPLRKDFKPVPAGAAGCGDYKFDRVEGEGIFELPVGPVHAGIIGPGHFRFSAAGEPILNLELRLGFTHRGAEKLFEGRDCAGAMALSERISGDAGFAHSLAFARAVEKISGAEVPYQASVLRAVFLELERMYNHVNDIGGIALDVGFSFAAAYASIIKEALLRLNEELSGSRYLRKLNVAGGISRGIGGDKKQILFSSLEKIGRDFDELAGILDSSVSFMDRVDTTGILRRKTAEDLGVTGPAARASGVPVDLRKFFPGVYQDAGFRMMLRESGDVLARLEVRILEFRESARLIGEFARRLKDGAETAVETRPRPGSALGYAEGWRGPVLYWLEVGGEGLIERCKIVDASFLNWQGLSFAVLGNIIPDFPVCNKSFDLSYPGNDL